MTYVTGLFKDWFRNVYEKTRVSFRVYVGFYPVKLRTFVGEPIKYDENRTVEELVDLTKQRLAELIKKNQRLPGSIWRALLDRFI